MHVDEAGRDVAAGGVDDLRLRIGLEGRSHRRDAIAGHGHVAHLVETRRRVHDMTALDEQVERHRVTSVSCLRDRSKGRQPWVGSIVHYQ